MTDDIRSRLRRGDLLAREGRYPEAVAVYDSVADEYAVLGFALRAIAISRSIVQIVDGYAPELAAARLTALTRLHALYLQLGLNDDAEKAQRLISNARE